MQPATLTVNVLRTTDELFAIRPEWDELLRSSGCTNPFMLWEWLAVWHDHLARGPLEMLVVRRDGILLGIVPFERVSYRLPLGPGVPTLQMIGRGSFQYEVRGLLCLPGYEDAVMRAVVSHLRRQWRWCCAVFDGFSTGDTAHRALTQLVEDRSDGVRQAGVRSYVLDLPDSWEAFRSSLKRNIKESLRHCYNSLARDGHTFVFEVWDEPERLPEALDRFLELHRMRAERETSVKHRDYFGRPAELRFLLEVAPLLLQRRVLHPCFLRVDGEIVAARLTFELGNQLYLYYSGFDPRWWKYSVATTITAECIRWAIERGLRTVNLSVGTDVSKTRWGGREMEHRSVVVVADGWLPQAVFALYSAIGRRDPERWKRRLRALPSAGH